MPWASPVNGASSRTCCGSQPRPRRGRTGPRRSWPRAGRAGRSRRPCRRAPSPGSGRAAGCPGRPPRRAYLTYWRLPRSPALENEEPRRAIPRRRTGRGRIEGPSRRGGRSRASSSSDGHAGGAVVGADEPRDVLGVVVGADDDVAGEPARDPGDDVAVRALDRDVANPGRTQPLDDEPDLAPGAPRTPPAAGRSRPGLRRSRKARWASNREAAAGGLSARVGTSPPPEPHAAGKQADAATAASRKTLRVERGPTGD